MFLQKYQFENTENNFENTKNNCQTCFWVFFILKNRKRFLETPYK